ncbi:glycosyltransferase [Mesorhizobium sp. 1B3]|uniref:glycosyltransferase n=1 Tax=Mesorhizobium sp. 1B3 TaxID=3243599 RepID=UPI003D99E647
MIIFRRVRPVSKVSVVTVTLNVRDSLRLTMESVAQQSFPNMEHVVIDGGSSDGTQAIAKEYPLGYFVSEQDNGVYDAMDKGAKAATGDVVIFLNAGDTFFDKNTVSEVARFFEECDADIVFGNILPVYLGPDDSHDHGAFTAGKIVDLSYMRDRFQLREESIHHQATFYRRHIFDNNTYACIEPVATGEYNLLLSAAINNGAKIRYISRTISRFVLGGISTKDFAAEWRRYTQAREVLQRLYFDDPLKLQRIRHDEFHSGPRIGRRMSIRQRIGNIARQSKLYRGYDRIMSSMAARVASRIEEKFREFFQSQAQEAVTALHDAGEANRFALEKAIVGTLQRTLERGQDRVALDLEALWTSASARLEQVERELAATRSEVRKMGSEIERRQVTMAAVLENMLVNQARGLSKFNGGDSFASAGYKIYSQWDEDGLIQYLISHCDIPNKTFVEIGVDNYAEANTKLLLFKDNWAGAVIDCDSSKIEEITSSDWFWKYSIRAKGAFVTAENINELILEVGYSGDVGLLSIDVDGMDYWLWRAVQVISPRIVVIEYNGIFGPRNAVTVPYASDFDRRRKHYSWLYAGASMQALVRLAEQKGYRLVGTNVGGNNAFFVRDDVFEAAGLTQSSRLFVEPQFRESRNPDGSLSFLGVEEGRALIAELEVVDVRTGIQTKIGGLSY